MAELLFQHAAPMEGVVRSIRASQRTTSDGQPCTIRYVIEWEPDDLSELYTVEQVSKRVSYILNNSRAFPAVGLWFRKMEPGSEAPFHIGVKKLTGCGVGAGGCTWPWPDGHARTEILESLFMDYHKGLLHEIAIHALHSWHMDERWPNYPYTGVGGGGWPRLGWLSPDDKLGLTHYLEGRAKSAL